MMEPAYEPKKYESEIYQRWEQSGFFNPDKLPGRRKKKYSISIPPPNITGSLHAGHALNNTIQDILIRFARLNNKKTLWVPGTDHAGIATQNVVEKELSKEGLNRHQLGREKFIEKAWQWKEKYGSMILSQLKQLGCSCDWSRVRFTLDKNYADAVLTAFVNYWKKGYLYRGPRIVNWCPRCATAISDIEMKYQEEKSNLWYIKYPFKDTPDKYITVATTRPETMLGDTAVAINPSDERYKNLVGQTLILPIVNREIPIVAHHLIDSVFGTGAVKITPAHDKVDWQIGKENKLEIINVIGPNGKMTTEAGTYSGMTASEARKKIIEKLTELNLLEKQEEYQHQISLCDRCSTPIEPQISNQWFIKMEKLAKPAIRAVKRGKIKIFPENYKKIYLDWLEKVEDWCISRQLWWGHRLPVWFCQNKNETFSAEQNENQYTVSVVKPTECPFCHKCEMKQSEDVLDTWFSSALWPFATLGWPQKTNDLKNYYPTSLLSTARDIIYLWVARMAFSGLEFLKKIPFKQVYIHATILDAKGRRMSKSLGNGINPLELIEKYGADATRFGLIYQTNRDQQAIHFDERALLSSRNFINKLWNVSRFIEMQLQKTENFNFDKTKIETLTLADRWIISKINYLIKSAAEKINNYEFGEAARDIYEFVWHNFADWYLEISKSQFDDEKLKNNTAEILYYSLDVILKILHPFVPFVTEEIYSQFKKNPTQMLIVETWPEFSKKFIDKKNEQKFEEIKSLIIEIRNWKNQNKKPLKEIINYKIENYKLSNEQKKMIETVAKVNLTVN